MTFPPTVETGPRRQQFLIVQFIAILSLDTSSVWHQEKPATLVVLALVAGRHKRRDNWNLWNDGRELGLRLLVPELTRLPARALPLLEVVTYTFRLCVEGRDTRPRPLKLQVLSLETHRQELQYLYVFIHAW